MNVPPLLNSYEEDLSPESPPVIEMYFQNSGCFTAIIEFSHNITTNIPLLFNRNGLTIEFGSNHSQYSQGSYGGCSSNHCFTLNGEDMKKYVYRSEYSKTILGFNCKTLLSAIKSKKKCAFRFYYYEGNSQVYIDKDSANEESNNLCKSTMIKHIPVDCIHYESKISSQPKIKFRMLASSLVDICTDCNKNNTFQIYISGNSKYLEFNGFRADNNKSYYSRHEVEEDIQEKEEKPLVDFDPEILELLNNKNIVPQEELIYYRLPKDLISAFLKIIKFSSPDAIVTMIYGHDLALQLKIKVSLFGDYVANISSN
jgi:hypothetical protein